MYTSYAQDVFLFFNLFIFLYSFFLAFRKIGTNQAYCCN